MTAKNKITADAFCNAWREVWNAKNGDARNEITKCLSGKLSTPLTKCMLANEDSFLVRVAEKLGFEKLENSNDEDKCVYQLEYDRKDLVLMSDYNKGFPLFFDVLIEHENAKHVENEMWKLVHIRSPLKVIVFYDHFGDELNKKLDELRKILRQANALFSENEKTEYLFIIGDLIGNSEEEYEIRWRRASHKRLSTRPLC